MIPMRRVLLLDEDDFGPGNQLAFPPPPVPVSIVKTPTHVTVIGGVATVALMLDGAPTTATLLAGIGSPTTAIQLTGTGNPTTAVPVSGAPTTAVPVGGAATTVVSLDEVV